MHVLGHIAILRLPACDIKHGHLWWFGNWHRHRIWWHANAAIANASAVVNACVANVAAWADNDNNNDNDNHVVDFDVAIDNRGW
jgi:hypothetical protein